MRVPNSLDTRRSGMGALGLTWDAGAGMGRSSCGLPAVPGCCLCAARGRGGRQAGAVAAGPATRPRAGPRQRATGPDSGASASTTSDTPRPPCSWNRASSSSSSRNSSATPTSASPPASTRTSDSASNAKPSTPSATPSAQRTTAPKTHLPQPSSADVAVSVAVKDQDAPFSTNRERGILPHYSTAPTSELAFVQELQDSFRSA